MAEAGASEISRFFSYSGACFATLAGVWALFDRAEVTATDADKRALGMWLREVHPFSASSDWAAGFADIFDKVFGRKHFSPTCFLRSALASLVAGIILTLIWFTVRPGDLLSIARDGLLVFGIIVYGAAFVTINVVFDYLSLYETRKLLGLVQNRRGWRMFILVLIVDIVLTFVIFEIGLLSFAFLFRGPESWMARFRDLNAILWQDGLALDSRGASGLNLGIFFYSMYFTSAWLWLYCLATLALLLVRRLDRVWGWFTNTRDLERQPYRSLGFAATAIMVLVMALAAPFILS